MARRERGSGRIGGRKLVIGLGASVLAVLLAVLPESVSASERREDDAATAARCGLAHFFGRAVSDGPEKYGFGAGERVDQARVGDPFRLYTITPAALAGYATGDGVSSVLTPTETWFVPVVLGGKIRSILTVDGTGGDCRAVALGKAPLAVELNKVLKRWPNSSGYEIQLVAVFQANAYFFAVPRLDDRNLNPFIFGGKGFGLTPTAGEDAYSSPVDFETIAEELKTAVSEKLAPLQGNGAGDAR
jgi:hypothetical protein